jgi:hypothetical protein
VTIVGTPFEWAGLIDPLVPDILTLVIATWEEMPSLSSDEDENVITKALCRALRKNHAARVLPFQIHFQQVELDPLIEGDLGIMDIVFNPSGVSEDIYFCLEGKRVNVVKDGKRRAYAAEYVNSGMLRFVVGRYAKAVRHGGMIAYVLDGNIAHAMTNVQRNIRRQSAALRMPAPGAFLSSTVLPGDARARETRHNRAHEAGTFSIHHLFMAAR